MFTNSTELVKYVGGSTVIEAELMDDDAKGLPPVEEDSLKPDPKFVAEQIGYGKDEEQLVTLAADTLDPKDKLKKYAKLGKHALKLANRRKASLKAGSWNGVKDLKKVCDDCELLVKSRIAIKTVEFDKYIRMHLFIEAVRPMVANVDDMPYGQVYHNFLPMLEFDPEALTGEIRKGWIGFAACYVDRQLSKFPLSIAELNDAIDAEKAKIAAEKESRGKAKTPEEISAAAAKVADRKLRADKEAAQSKISDAISKALDTDHATPADVAEIAAKVLKLHNLEMPVVGGFDIENCTKNDVRMLAQGLQAAGKVSEMRVLRDTLDQMLKVIDNALITTKAG